MSTTEEIQPIRLTQFSKGSGCGCKIAPDQLEKILAGVTEQNGFPDLLVGSASKDDAVVMDQGNGNALVCTTDFFTPIVDDAYDLGRIAAANALSDVYAMGAKPLLALAILGWPVDKIPAAEATRMLNGARDVCSLAGIPLAGGHSIDIPEPVFGLSVTGNVRIDQLKRNDTATAGCKLILTKPIGTGILSTAAKRDIIADEAKKVWIDTMAELNSIGHTVAELPEVTAMTDVTGFGLLGHLLEMCEGSGVSSRLYKDDIPELPGVRELLTKSCYPDGTFRNWRSYGSKVKGSVGTDMLLYSDPQTSGGLLIAVRPEGMPKLNEIFSENNIPYWCIGDLVDKGKHDHRIELVSGSRA